MNLWIDPSVVGLHAELLEARFPGPLGSVAGGFAEWLRQDREAPVAADDALRVAVRDLLRAGGFKPSGRSKPASEYLVRAVGAGELGAINAAVDACNVVSLHSGLPISVVDLDRAVGPLRIAVAPAAASYVFNASGQTLDLGGLLCLWDAEGPCANAVKDAQRTKTRPETTRTLSVVWAPAAYADHARAAADWYAGLLRQVGAEVERSARTRPA
jgi:DNA/RNA-binding domain of Phe-tRNA-synthetase-like protein